MLQSRNLDDQRFEDIVREAAGRLPWLCPVWTDHNSHDPGITILDLIAWFKESVQYEMNRIGPETARKLLELAGTDLSAERAAECAIRIPPDAPARAMYSTMETPEGVVFELAEEIPHERNALQRAMIERLEGKGFVDVTEMLTADTVFQPFEFGGEQGSALVLDFRKRAEEKLRIWFEVARPDGVERNAPDADTVPPRTLVWELSGIGEVTPLCDETLALSRSGYVTLPLTDAWRADSEGLYRLVLRQTEAGCEERVRLQSLSTDRYRAMQTESRARLYRFTVKPQKQCRAELHSAQARRSETAVFLRDQNGWQQIADYTIQRGEDGLRITLDASAAIKDGADNLLVACLDPIRLRDLLFDATGRPGESFRLNLGGKGVLTDSLTLMCQTLCEDGEVRPALWRCVEDLTAFGPRDRVFVYDRKRETISVGDGAHGTLIAPGSGAVMVVEELVSLCGAGNIPADAGLYFTEDGEHVGNIAAQGGCEAETIADARGRLLRRLEDSRKCVSTRDYERQALRTPGLRVAGARALPDYDIRHKHQKTPAYLSVAVLPDGDDETPVPDQRFLDAVSRQLNRSRAVCIRTEAIPVRYADISVNVRVWGEQGFRKESAEKAIADFFSPCGDRIGAGVNKDDLVSALQKLPGVLQIDRVEFRGMDQNSYQTATGDLTVMPDTILHLRRAEVSLVKDGR